MKRILTLVSLLVTLTLATVAMAKPFTPGDIVVCRVGDGTQTLTNTGNSVFLDEYTTDGEWVQSVMMPTNYYFGANSPLILPGSGFAGGLISRSVDGRFILVNGYGATLGQFTNFSLFSTYGTEAPRVIALVDGNGHIDSTTAQTNSLVDQEDFRSAASTDGTNLWFTGGSSGIRYTTRGSPLATNIVSTPVANIRQLNIFSNQLYFSSMSGGQMLVGTVTNGFSGLPTTTNGAAEAALPGVAGVAFGPWSFALFNLSGATNTPFDTLYVADGSYSPNAVLKFSLVGTNWVFNGYVEAYGAFGLAASKQIVGGTTNVNLYITGNTIAGNPNANGGDTIYTWTDSSGYNGSFSGDADVNIVAFSGAAESLRGIVFAPVGGEMFPTGPGQLSIGPILGFFSTGLTGCSDSDTQNYYLANPGTDTVSWAASADQTWVALSPASGTLNSGGTLTVAASFNGNVTSLGTGTNLATITFTNTTSALGTTTRQVRLIMSDQIISPSSDFMPSGQPGGPFSPSNKVYTVRNGSTSFTLTVSKTATWLNLSATNISLGACAATNITVSLNANSLASGTYGDVLSFSNASAGTLIATRNVTLTAGGILFCDDFSTFTQDASLDGQQGWVASGSGSALQVTNNAVYDPALAGGPTAEEPYKNLPVLSNGDVYAAMVITVTSAPPVSTTSPSRGPTFFTAQNEGGYARDYLSARDVGTNTSHFVFCIRINGCTSYTFGTTPLNYNTPYRVIIHSVPATNTQWVYVSPAGSVEATNTAYAFSGGGCVDANIACFSFNSQYSSSATTPSPGYVVSKLCITTNYADAYYDITPSCVPPTNAFTATPTLGTAPLSVTFTDLTTGTVTSNSTAFGDGGAVYNLIPPTNFVHSYSSAGTYLVTNLEIGCGRVCTSVLTVTVCPQPVASFNATSATFGQEPLTVSFNDTSTGATGNRHWAFGDGATFDTTGTTASHPYNNGAWNVSLTVSNCAGASNTLAQTGYVTVLTQYNWWRSNYFGSVTNPQGDPTADPLGKGISNTNQFLLGLNPTNPASVFRITSVVQTPTNVTVAWKTAGVRTNVVQGAVGTAAGGYSNNFTDISGGIIINVTGDTSTNCVDQSGTNRFYRIRLGP